jgi:hypothetical protein
VNVVATNLAGGALRTIEDARRAFADDPVRARVVAHELDREEFNRRAAPGTWSVGECLEHLIVVGTQVQPRLGAAIDATRAAGWTTEPGGELTRTSWFDRAFVHSMGVKGDREVPFKVRAPRRFQPANDLDPSDVLARFDVVCAGYAAQLERARGLDLARMLVPSILLPIVRVRLGVWYLAYAAHQDRHLRQAARARAALPMEALR